MAVVGLNSWANVILFRTSIAAPESFMVLCHCPLTVSTLTLGLSDNCRVLGFLLLLLLFYFVVVLYMVKDTGLNMNILLNMNVEFFGNYLLKMLTFSSVCFWSLCRKLDDYCYAHTCLALQFCSTGLHAYFCVSTILFLLLWLCDISWSGMEGREIRRHVQCISCLLPYVLCSQTTTKIPSTGTAHKICPKHE